MVCLSTVFGVKLIHMITGEKNGKLQMRACPNRPVCDYNGDNVIFRDRQLSPSIP